VVTPINEFNSNQKAAVISATGNHFSGHVPGEGRYSKRRRVGKVFANDSGKVSAG
jgi:hypothetical protein